ncbi:hypothetical protein D3C78_1398350 [compost metagenome]
MDIWRLMSLISAMVRPTSFSRSTSTCWLRWMSACRRAMASAYLALPPASAADQFRSTSLPGNSLRKSARGMRASRTHSCMIARSCWRTRSRAPRTMPTSTSNCLGTSLIGMNSSARATSSALACVLPRPYFFRALWATASCSATAVKRRSASSGSGPPSPSSSVLSDFSLSSSSSSSSTASLAAGVGVGTASLSAGRVPSSGSM